MGNHDHFYLTERLTEAQGDALTCLRPHSQGVEERFANSNLLTCKPELLGTRTGPRVCSRGPGPQRLSLGGLPAQGRCSRSIC